MTDYRDGETVLLHETFDGYHREQDGGAFQASHWDAKWDAAVTSRGDAGKLKTETLDVAGHDAVTVTFDLRAWLSSRHADFEEQGEHGADSLEVVLLIDGEPTLLDTFTYDGHRFVGSVTGQTFGLDGDSTIEYPDVALNGAAEAKLVFDSTVTACDEFIKLDNVKITAAKTVPDDDCAPKVEELIHEDFEDIHWLEQSENVSGHTDWKLVDGQAMTTDHREGALTFKEVALDGHDAGELRFDIRANDVHRFESRGHAADRIEVQIKTGDGHWVTIDTLQRDGRRDVFRGDQSGQEFGDGQPTTLVYRNEAIEPGQQTVQFRLVSKITAWNEKLYVDNVKLTVEKTVCDKCPEPEGFDGVAAGTIVADQFEHLTISAFANEHPKTIHLEAEEMHDWNFDKKFGSQASGHKFEKLNPHADHGALWDHFDGHSGTYQVHAAIQDENDGVSTVIFKIDGHEVERVHLDKQSHQGGSDHGAFDKVDFGEHHIGRGQQVAFVFLKDGHELGRVDKFTFTEVLGEPENRAMIFDADNPTGGDRDLGGGDGNVLIISEDGDSHDPDDNAKGGTIHLDFDVDVFFTSFKAIDTEEGGKVALFDADGTKIGEVEIPRVADAAVQTVDLGAFADQAIRKAVVTLNGSGAIDDLCYEKAGAPAPAALGDFVFFDRDGDGLQDAGETGVEGVVVALLDGDGNAVLDGGGQAITQTTGADGGYLFENLAPGDYQIRFDPATLPNGFAFTDPDAGDDALDSDADIATGLTEVVTLAAGDENRTLDAGVIELAALGDFVFEDLDADGVQDPADPGVAGVAVRLLDATGAAILDGNGNPVETVTDANGFYSFTGLRPGAYRVGFEQPAGFAGVSDPGVGGDAARDSDGAGPDLVTAPVTLGQGEVDNDLDQGFFRLAELGDLVWLDDGDGIFDAATETGAAGVTVELYAGSDIPGLDAPLATQTTDANGLYRFTDLRPGSYTVLFVAPDGFDVTAQNVGPDEAVDSDPDAAGVAGPVTLVSGESNLDIDAGLVANPPPEAANDALKLCAPGGTAMGQPTTGVAVVDVLANDTDDGAIALAHVSDADGAGTVTINGVGDSITLTSGAVVTVVDEGDDGVFEFEYDSAGAVFAVDRNGAAEQVAAADLLIGEQAADRFTYSIVDENGAEATATVDVTICGAKNTLDTIAASLPDTLQFRIVSTEEDGGFVDLTVSNSGDPRLDGLQTDDAFCVDFSRDLEFGRDLDANLYLADPDRVPDSVIQNESNLDLVNWILNQDYRSIDNGDGAGETYNGNEIQAAIWFLLEDKAINVPFFFPGTNENAQEIVDDAFANGENFEAGEGDIVGLILDPLEATAPPEGAQPFIIGVPFADLEQDCLCV